MLRKVFLFLGLFIILVGLQVFLTDRVYLTSQFTRALAERNDPSITRKAWWYEAIYGEPVKIPEKEIAVPEWLGYVIIGSGGMMWLNGATRK